MGRKAAIALVLVVIVAACQDVMAGPRRGFRRRQSCPPASCAPRTAHQENPDCRYAIAMTVGGSCYWIHLNCSTGTPYGAYHQMWEPCGSPKCTCSGMTCVSCARNVATGPRSMYTAIPPATDFTDVGIQTKFNGPAANQVRRTIHYAWTDKGYRVTNVSGTQDFEIQLLKIQARLRPHPLTSSDKPKKKTFWVGYQVETAARNHADIVVPDAAIDTVNHTLTLDESLLEPVSKPA